MLIDDGQTPSPEKLVSEMDKHIQAMAGLLGQSVPNMKFPWVRGSLLGRNGGNVALNVWAICGTAQKTGELTESDRHEVAHTLIRELSGPDQDPPGILIEGWAMSQESANRDALLGSLAKYQRFGDALMPVSEHFQFADGHCEQTYQSRVRPMSQTERQELKQRVERSAVLGVDPFRWLRRLLSVIVIGCPLVGVTLLGIARWCKPT